MAKERAGTSRPGLPEASTEEVIDRLYDVAVDPLRYEELLDHWEAMIAPYRKAANLHDAPPDPPDGLLSHVTRAERLLDRLDTRSDAITPKQAVQAIDLNAAFAVNTNLRIERANRAAKTSFGIRKGDRLEGLPLEPSDLAAFCAKLQQLIRSNDESATLVCARLADLSRMVVFHLRLVRDTGTLPFLLVVSSEFCWPNGFTELVQSAFGLTDAECDVVRGLTEGQGLKDIAKRRGRSVETIRAQLRSVMGKTETRTQAELVRLTLSTMEMTAYTEHAAASSAAQSRGLDQLDTIPFHRHRLPDDRIMEYLVLGDFWGRPCLYLPNDFGLARWPAEAEAAAAARGLKIIVPVRAGYGGSDSLPVDDDVGPVIAADILSLLDDLGVKRCPVLSQGGDFHFVAQIFALAPDRLSAAVACAGVLPYVRPEQYERMDKWHRFILAGARYTPHILPFMVKAGFSLARRIGKRGFMHAVYGNSPSDLAAIETPHIMEAILVGSDITLSAQHSAHHAFAREIISQETIDWSDKVRAMKDRVPVIFLNGLQDPQVAAVTLQEYEEDFPWITVERFPQAGQLVFFTHWERALQLLDTYADQSPAKNFPADKKP